MARVKRAVAKRHRKKKYFKIAKGNWGAKSRQWRTVREAAKRAGNFAFRDRKNRKREFRRLWIVRINAAARLHGVPYHRLMAGLKAASVGLDRKQLAELAVNDEKTFSKLVEKAVQAGSS